MAYREDERGDLLVDEDLELQDPVAEDVIQGVGEEVDPDSLRPLTLVEDEDELVLAPDDEDALRGR